MSWRYIDLGSKQAAFTAAADEAMLIARSQGAVPDTLGFYSRSTPTVSLGYFEKAEECVDLGLCREKGIHVVRRLSGGSAIYTDPGQVIYTLVMDATSVPESPAESFPVICAGIVNALALLGVSAEHKPLNDVVVKGRKISGSAQTRKMGIVLQHGTVIVDSDLDLMMRVLRKRPEKPHSADDMTSVTRELGRTVGNEEVRAALVQGFSAAFRVHMEEASLTAEEMEAADRLVEEKYGKEVYTFQR